MIRPLLLSLLLVPVLASAEQAAAPSAPYPVFLTAKAHYDVTGQLTKVEFVDAASHPAGFLAHVEAQLKKRPITPPQVDDAPATFDTAIYVAMTITPKPGGADAKMDSVGQGPLLVRRTSQPYPRELRDMENWTGKLVGECTVSIEGRCGRIDIAQEDPGMPEPARRYVRETMQKWKFEPQRVGGKPIEAKYQSSFTLQTGEAAPPEYFGGTRL